MRALLELHVLDTDPEERFDRVVRFAQRLFDVPKVAVNLVAHERLFTKSAVGLPLGDVRRDLSFCSHTVDRPEPLVVPDLREDERFASHPYVVSGAVRFYAGQPLAAPGGELVGALCLVDDKPREMTEHELELLADLGRWVERELAVDADEVQAREVQRRLLPYRPIAVEGYQVAGACVPARLVGGDYYDWMLVDDDLQLVVADVMGKGLTASVLCAGIRAMLRGASSFNPLAEAVRRTAVGMAEDFAETSTYATLFACRIEPSSGKVEYVDAGHGLTLVVSPDGSVRQLTSYGLPLGTFTDEVWLPQHDVLAPGDTLFVVSDGVLDVHPDESAVIAAASRLVRDFDTPADIVAHVEQYARSHDLEDDLTAVVVRRLPA